MIDNSKLEYLTTASWLSGYANGLQEEDRDSRHVGLIHHLRQAARLLDNAWYDYMEKEERPDGEPFGGTE